MNSRRIAFSVAAIAGILIFFSTIFGSLYIFFMQRSDASFRIEEDFLVITSSFRQKILIGQSAKIEIIDAETHPLKVAKKINGISSGKCRRGDYSMPGYEKPVYLNVSNIYSSYIKITNRDGIFFLNFSTIEKTAAVYKKLKENKFAPPLFILFNNKLNHNI